MATQIRTASSTGEIPSAKLPKGKSLRQSVPRSAHAVWSPAPNRTDPVEIIREQDVDRLQELVPIRHERMSRSPFAFFRGAAAVMAADLASTPSSGSLVQACGDSHLSNFGAFATPERNLIFDVNDFDETLHAPWEWDVKRLAASTVLAARELDMSEKRCHKAAASTVRSYRESIHLYSEMSALDIWYSRIDAVELVQRLRNAPPCRNISKVAQLAHRHTLEHISPNLIADASGIHQIVDDVPLVFHRVSDEKFESDRRASLISYRESLRDDVRMLFGRYRQVDLAMKVVGIGSVGTRCAIALYQAGAQDLLMLQIKEATTSVLERYGGAGSSGYTNQGERCVRGQRLMQAASDLFLGWTVVGGRDFYIRQFRDMKAGVDLTRMNEMDLVKYSTMCSNVLARAHARTGDAAFIADYLGDSDNFDEAVADFAVAYADQTKRDYDGFMEAIESGKLSRSGDLERRK